MSNWMDEHSEEEIEYLDWIAYQILQSLRESEREDG
jgi:hypothetical protein